MCIMSFTKDGKPQSIPFHGCDVGGYNITSLSYAELEKCCEDGIGCAYDGNTVGNNCAALPNNVVTKFNKWTKTKKYTDINILSPKTSLDAVHKNLNHEDGGIKDDIGVFFTYESLGLMDLMSMLANLALELAEFTINEINPNNPNNIVNQIKKYGKWIFLFFILLAFIPLIIQIMKMSS